MTVLWYVTIAWAALAVTVALLICVVLRGAERGAQQIGARRSGDVGFAGSGVDREPPGGAPLQEPVLQ